MTWFWRRWKLGFKPSDCWNLDITFAEFVLPRLKYFKTVNNGYPESAGSMKGWNEILDKMILSFENIADEKQFFERYNKPETIEGLDLFRKYYRDLWW